jgi:hypothetical protein
MIIIDILLVLSFAIIFNWAVNVQVLAIYEKNKRDKSIAIALALLASVILGLITRV